MFEISNVVRIFSIFYVFLAIIVAVILWRNSEAPDSIQNTGIVLAGLIPVLIAILPYLKIQSLSNEYTLTLFYDGKENQLVSGELFSPYSNNYFDFFLNIKFEEKQNHLVSDTLDESWVGFGENTGFDIIERGIIVQLMRKFYSHWDITYKTIKTPSGTSTRGNFSSKECSIFKSAEIEKLFIHNALVQEDGLNSYPEIKLPPKSNLSVDVEDRRRTILIENEFANPLKIEIIHSGGGVSPGGAWGILPPSETLRVLEYNVKVEIEFDRFKNFAPGKKSYTNWYKNICSDLEPLTWDSIDKEVEKELLRKMLNKVEEK